MTMNGIDIADYQANLNAGAIDADFVIVKATQGTWYVNPCCDKHYQQAKAAGKLLGTYHYAEGGDAKAEADYFLKNIQGYIKEAILCLDWEENIGQGAKNPVFGTAGAPAWIKTWCDYVFSKTGVRPLVYIQASALADVKGIGDYGLWVAQYANNELTGYQEHPWNEGAYTCAIRQYTSHGRLAGYGGDLDLDIAYMDATAWHKYANPSGDYKPAEPVRKSNDQIADEVIAGVWGNGEDRKNRLTQAGYDYNAIQDIVNKKSAPVRKSNDEIANEVIAGQWGDGNDRKNRLTAAGYDYNAIQNIVNQKLGVSRDNSIHVGDNVRVLNAVTYTGTPFKLYYSTYKVMELNGDRAVIGVNGQVTAAINVNNLVKA